jgi:ParG
MSPRSRKYTEPARLNLNVERELYQRFKAACALRGEKMTDVLVDYIQSYIDGKSSPKASSPAKSTKA